MVPEKEATHFLIGKAVHLRISGTPEQYKDTFHVSKLVKKPGDGALAALKMAYQACKKLEIESEKEVVSINPDDYYVTITDVAQQAGYYADPKYNNNRFNTLFKEGNGSREYWQDMVEGDGKLILSKPDEELSRQIVGNFLTHPHTAHWFKTDHEDDVDIVFEFPCYWKRFDIPCKALIDVIIINHTKEEIWLFDIKTTSEYVLNFNRAVKKRRYDIQGSFYTEGVMNCFTQLATLVGEHLTGYSIKNFAFMVESTTRPGVPMIYPMTNDLLDIGRKGDGRYLLGWEQGLYIFNDWRQYNFDLNKRFANSNGVVMLDMNFDYTENF